MPAPYSRSVREIAGPPALEDRPSQDSPIGGLLRKKLNIRTLSTLSHLQSDRSPSSRPSPCLPRKSPAADPATLTAFPDPPLPTRPELTRLCFPPNAQPSFSHPAPKPRSPLSFGCSVRERIFSLANRPKSEPRAWDSVQGASRGTGTPGTGNASSQGVGATRSSPKSPWGRRPRPPANSSRSATNRSGPPSSTPCPPQAPFSRPWPPPMQPLPSRGAIPSFGPRFRPAALAAYSLNDPTRPKRLPPENS